MAIVLMLIIYIAFIGLGIPDSLFGTAWPAIYSEFELPILFGSFVTMIISCGTVISSIVSAKVIARLGTNKVSAYSTLLTAAALLGFSFAPNLWTMCFLAIILGIGAGAIDVALNNYVALHYSATHMSFLHCFYGIGVSVSPYIVSLVINGKYGWRGGYRSAFVVQLAITFLLFISLPLWKKVHGIEKKVEESKSGRLSFKSILKIPGVKMMCGLFILSCGIEYTCGGWGSTFLVEYRKLPMGKAAQVIMLYYVGMTLGRFLSGLLARKLHSWKIIKLGQIVLGIALLLLIIPGNECFCGVGMFLIGLGNGPLFPNFNYLTPENFGRDISQSVMGVQMAFSYIGIMLVPAFCGLLGQMCGMIIFPFYLIVLYVGLVLITISVRKVLKKTV